MNRIKLVLLVLTAFAGLVSATAADAGGRYHHHHGARVGVFIGAPLLAYSYYAWPRYYYPPAYYPAPGYPAQAVAPTYIEQAPAAPQQGSSVWYFCRDSQTYYPYVKTCPSPWQEVAPNS